MTAAEILKKHLDAFDGNIPSDHEEQFKKWVELAHGKAIIAAMEEYTSYWKARCILAENYISESPCDPDITKYQLAAYTEWQKVKNQNQ